MPDVFSILGMDFAEGNQRAANLLIESVTAEQEARPGLDESHRSRLSQVAIQFAGLTLIRAREARSIWDNLRKIIFSGTASQDAKELVQMVTAVLDSWLAMAKAACKLWEDILGQSRSSADEFKELARLEEEMKGLKASADQLHAFLSREPKPIDADRLRQGEADVAEGRIRTAEEMQTRLAKPLK